MGLLRGGEWDEAQTVSDPTGLFLYKQKWKGRINRGGGKNNDKIWGLLLQGKG